MASLPKFRQLCLSRNLVTKYIKLNKRPIDSSLPLTKTEECRMSSMDILVAFIKSIGLVTFTLSVYYIGLDSQRFPRDFKVKEDTMSSTVFTTDTLPKDPRLMATIGNGYIATRVFSDAVFVSGVYNGRRREPSHRARIPSTAAIRWSLAESQDAVKTTYSLDVARGVFLERSEGDGFVIEELVYAHRKRKHLVVIEIIVRNARSRALKINLVNSQGKKSADIVFQDVSQSNSEFPAASFGQTKAMYGEINTTEEANSDKVGVAVAWTTVPESIDIEARTNRTFYFITAIVTSLDTVDYLRSALDFHQEATRNSEGLLGGHSEEWARIWKESSIEVQGDLKLAQALYASLYYILR